MTPVKLCFTGVESLTFDRCEDDVDVRAGLLRALVNRWTVADGHTHQRWMGLAPADAKDHIVQGLMVVLQRRNFHCGISGFEKISGSELGLPKKK